MSLGVEPGVERLAALGRDRQHVIAATALRLLAVGDEAGTAAIRPPPQIGAPISFVDRERPGVAGVLRRDRARRVLGPSLGAVETLGLRGWADGGLVHPAAALKIVGRGYLSRHALTEIGVFEPKGGLPVPGAAATRSM